MEFKTQLVLDRFSKVVPTACLGRIYPEKEVKDQNANTEDRGRKCLGHAFCLADTFYGHLRFLDSHLSCLRHDCVYVISLFPCFFHVAFL